MISGLALLTSLAIQDTQREINLLWLFFKSVAVQALRGIAFERVREISGPVFEAARLTSEEACFEEAMRAAQIAAKEASPPVIGPAAPSVRRAS